jgi:hypothetical protein
VFLFFFILFLSFAQFAIASQTYEIIEKPKGSYKTGETIYYRIKISPPNSNGEIRLREPKLEFENLTLIGIGRETGAQADATVSGASQINAGEILTFKFAAEKPGKASIKWLELAWQQPDGTPVESFEVPPFSVKIVSARQSLVLIISIISSAILLIGGLFIFFFIKNKKSKLETEQSIPDVCSLETKKLQELKLLEQSIATSGSTDSPQKLHYILIEYLKEKFDWQPGRGGYNALEKIALTKWSKKDTQELKNLFQLLDEQRFSGTEVDRKKIMDIYKRVYLFIEQRKTIAPTEPEALWKPV